MRRRESTHGHRTAQGPDRRFERQQPASRRLGRAAHAFAREDAGLVALPFPYGREAQGRLSRARRARSTARSTRSTISCATSATSTMHSIDVALLDELCRVYETFDGRGSFEVISGYRSPQTNEALRQRYEPGSRRTASTSRAARSTFASPARRRIVCATRRSRCSSGGVGYYAESNFVHIDTGEFRTW